MRKIEHYHQSKYLPERSLYMYHEKESLKYISGILSKYDFKLIIELGTAKMGFTLFLHECDKEIPIYSFDKLDVFNEEKYGLFNQNVHFINEDVLVKANSKISSLLSKNTHYLLYCDNGDKVKEISMYSSLITKGNIIAVHDWGVDIDFTHKSVTESLVGFSMLDYDVDNEHITTRFFIKL